MIICKDKGRGIIMGNVLLARILEYLNGTLFLNDYYRFCVFFIQNYIDFYKLSLEEVSEKSHIMKESILSFLSYLGFHDFDEFQTKLFQDVILRSDQIRSRMLGLKLDDLFEQVHMCDDKEAFMEKLDKICQDISNSKRVVLIGALYPMSIAVEFQTDLITFGKPVLQYHAYDHELKLDEDDYVIFISATGRAVNNFMNENDHLDCSLPHTLLITQNKQYEKHMVTDDILIAPSSRHDSIDFNYRLMTIFDILRVTYYKKYHFI